MNIPAPSVQDELKQAQAQGKALLLDGLHPIRHVIPVHTIWGEQYHVACDDKTRIFWFSQSVNVTAEAA